MRCIRTQRLVVFASALLSACFGLQLLYFSRWGPGYSEPRLPSTRIPIVAAPPSLATSLFRYNITPTLDTSNTRLLLLIISAPSEHRRRRLIRHSWAQWKLLDKISATAVFVVGASSNPSLHRSYQQEAAEFGDILFDDKLTDSYKNLTRKVLSALYWVSSHSWKQLRYVGKVDSDNFVTISSLKKAVALLSPTKAEIVGRVWFSSFPIRDVKEKWFVSKEDYPYDRFPNYANGPAYLMTMPALQTTVCLETLQDLQNGHALFLEDVFITGILRQRFGIDLKHEKKFTVEVKYALKNLRLIHHFMFLHNVSSRGFDLLQAITSNF